MKSFNDFSEAFDFCREVNTPITALVKGEKWKLFPSGRAEKKEWFVSSDSLPTEDEPDETDIPRYPNTNSRNKQIGQVP